MRSESRLRAEAVPDGTEATRTYVAQIDEAVQDAAASAEAAPPSALDPVDAVLLTLTGRRHTYLSRARTEAYLPEIRHYLETRRDRGEPTTFHLDIGPGYHASLHPGVLPLRFEIGLAELLLLHQAATFVSSASAVFPPGIEFALVVDDVCGRYVNRVPAERTAAYCAQLRELIGHYGLDDRIALVVESETVDPGEYDARYHAALEQVVAPATFDPKTPANVERFTGRPMTAQEVTETLRRYQAATAVTNAHFDDVLDGVRMTQRATARTFGFRGYPGGDTRIQCGEICVAMTDSGRTYPVLVTSTNREQFQALPVDVSRQGIPHLLTVTCVY